jgi:hypothetical protein
VSDFDLRGNALRRSTPRDERSKAFRRLGIRDCGFCHNVKQVNNASGHDETVAGRDSTVRKIGEVGWNEHSAEGRDRLGIFSGFTTGNADHIARSLVQDAAGDGALPE